MTRALALVERLDAVLLYAFALGAALLGIWIVIPVMQPTSFVYTSFTAVSIGFGLSFLLSRPALNRGWLVRVIAGAAGVVALYEWASSFLVNYVHGGVMWITVDQSIMVLMIGVMVGTSYALFTRNMVLFSVIPPVTIYGLMASNLISEQLTWGFLGVLFAGLQVAGLDYYASRREAAGGRSVRGLAGHILVVAALFALLAIIGAAVTGGIRFLGGRYRPPIDTAIGPAPHAAASRARGSFLNWLYRFEVGTGPAQLSPEVVLRLESPEPLYLRARVYDRFSGASWAASGPVDRATRPFSEVIRRSRPPGEARRVAYTVALEEGSTLLYHAAHLAALDDLVVPYGAPPSVLGDTTGALHATPPLAAGTRYRAESLIRDFDPSQRHTVPVTPHDFLGSELITPDTSQPAVDLALRLTRGAGSLEEKAQILAGWVGVHADYSSQADSFPLGEDVTTYFVEQRRLEAYCDAFATAFAVMARGVGIPSRLVTGYRADAPDPEEGVYLVRGTDAHAWAEIYLPEQGWVIVDPTPGESVGLAPTTWWEDLFGGGLVSRDLGLLIALPALLALVVLIALRSGLRLPGLARGTKLPGGLRAVMARHYQQACRLLGRLGIPRRPAQTPTEYLAAVALQAPQLDVEAAVPALDALTGRFQRARYSPHAVTPEEIEQAVGEVERLRRALRGRRKKRRRRAPDSSENKSS